MNKSELIRKTAKLAGAPEADASLFFEIFIRSAADILNPGDVVQIKDLGFLHYKIAKADGKEVLKNLKTVFPGSGWVDLIIFSESSEKIPADPQFFVVPAKYELDFAEIDAPFSLSFNKPVIQHVQKREAYFIPQSYGELVRLLESKAARLLVNAKVIKNENKENEVFISGAAAVDEQAMTFVKPGENKIKEPEKEIISAEIPEEKINKSEEPEVKHSPEEKEEEGKIKFAQEALNRENKKEITPSGEIPDEKSDQPEQELEKPAFGEIKVEKKTEPETGKTEEEMWVQESKTDIVPGEEFKDEQPETKTEEAKTGIIPEETKKEEKSSKEREIDKLLSKGSFGANIPWKFDEISIIEPGKKDEPEEENAEEQSPEEEDNPKEKEEETLAGVEPAEEKTEEKESAESAPAEETVEQAPAETSEIVHPEIIDENLNLQAPREVSVPPEDKVVTPEEEKPAEETEYKSEFKDSEFAEQQQLSDETAPGTKPEASVHEEAPEDKRDFSDAEGLVSSGDTSINREEKNIEEAGAEPKETAEKPAEDQGYEVIKPVKLKYDWKEGYLKESEESPVPDEHEEEENMEQEMPDDEGYIEIKPDASKEKIDFLADNEEEEQQVVKEEAAIPAEDQAQKDLKEYISKIEEIDKQTSHKRRNTTILAVIIFLLFVGIGVFLYYQYIFKKNNPAPVKSMTVVVKNAKTINRDFEIPVTYPYNKNENKGALYTQPIDSSIIAASQPPSNKVTTPPGSKTQNTVVQQEPPKLESMGGYIFKQGDDYIVQVSSFETQTRAETQAESWKKAHYDAFVRLDKRPNKTYYCVMIRGFKSYDEAKHFLK